MSMPQYPNPIALAQHQSKPLFALNNILTATYLAPSTSHWLSNSTHPSDSASATVLGCAAKAKLSRGLNIHVVLKLYQL